MAKSEKKVSIALFDKISKEHFNNDTVVQWHDAEVRVKHSISISDVLAFVDDVVESCFHEKYGYMPELRDFAIKANILSRYANFSLPDNLDHRYQMVYCTDAVDTVCGSINTTQLQEIVDAIDEKIQFKRDTMISEIHKRIDQAVSSIEEMAHKTEEIFSGMTKADVDTMLSAAAGNRLDEQKLVKAYMDQKNAERQEDAANEPVTEEAAIKVDDGQ